jgi:inner membrane transporter RhtA
MPAALLWRGALGPTSCSTRTRRFNTLEGLAVAMGVAALVSTPLGVATAGTALLNPVAVGLAVGVALVATVVPYALDNIALRNLPESTFGVLMSLDPALATVAGLLILGQGLGPAEVLATALVIVASMGAVATTRTSPDARQVERSAPPG